ncbi:helix-turn-helix domain-containing protein [Streptomyces sp. MAR4 CNX-425]|uniref:helix-turn-helix domain-containing protein n=1 Tax=Streptomyces sp. MAR4 CNX-425 TaxID=3406343 RepID=UPI003B501A70
MANYRVLPTVRRRRLGDALRRFRTEANFSLEAASGAMGWDPAKLSKIENAKGRIRPADVEPLLAGYGVVDRVTVTALTMLAEDAQKTGWWQTYGDVPAQTYRDYISVESDAVSARICTPAIIPGLFQTGEYAREIITATTITRTPEEITALAEIRKARQSVLTRPDDPLRFWAVIGEAALRQRFLSRPGLMRSQLLHLLDMTELPHVTVQIIPSTTAPNPAMVGVFTLFEFPAPWPAVVNTENLRGGQFAEDPDEVKIFEQAFERVTMAALPAEESRQAVKAIMEGH